MSESILNQMLQPQYTFHNLLLIVLAILIVKSIFSERPSSLVVSDFGIVLLQKAHKYSHLMRTLYFI